MAERSNTVSNFPLVEAVAAQKGPLLEIQDSAREQLEELLAGCAGHRPASLEDGQNAAHYVNELVASFGYRIKHPDEEIPVTLAYKSTGNAKPGAFVYEYGGTTKYGGVALPQVQIIPMHPHILSEEK